MECIHILIPKTTVQIVAVFWQTGKVNDTKQRAMTWPCIRIIRRRLTQIIEAGPYKLSDGPVMIVRQSEVLIGDVGP